MSSIFKIDQLVDKITDYFKVKLDLVKLDLIEEGSGFLIKVLSLFVVVSLSLFVLLFAAMGMVVLINNWLESNTIGYFVLSLCFGIVLLLFLVLFKQGVLQRFLEKQLLEKEKEEKPKV